MRWQHLKNDTRSRKSTAQSSVRRFSYILTLERGTVIIDKGLGPMYVY